VIAMNPAKYNRRIEIQEKQPIRNSDGEWEENWTTTRKIWAQKLDKGGDEYFVAKASDAIRTVLWNVRYDKELQKNGEGKRLYYDEQSYDIKNVSDKTGLKKELEITTEVVVS
jgi:SPP1 family predicted phage head-tail adaptor